MAQRIIGASLLIAGTMIGAGMLALPMISSEMGFIYSVGLLCVLWLFMVIAAYAMVALCHGKGRSIVTIAEEKLGSFGKGIASLSLLTLFWTLLGAYISGGSSVLAHTFGCSRFLMAALYTIILGASVAFCTKAVDYANRFLFLIKIIVFGLLIAGMFPFIEMKNLAGAGDSGGLLKAIPVFFTSFGFHGSLPVLINYLHGNKRHTYLSILIGSAIPLCIYILWQAVSLGVLAPGSFLEGSVGEFIQCLANKTENAFIAVLVDLFAFFAMATSFLGVALSLFDYFSERFIKEKKTDQKVLTATLTFALPFVFAVLYPKGFIVAIGFAAIALSLLAACLPGMILLKEKTRLSLFLHKGIGVVILAGGIFIIFLELVNKIN